MFGGLRLALAAEGSDPMPWGVIATLVIALTASGLLVAWVGRRAERGELRRNRWMGIRTRTTMASDEAWAAAHRAGGRLLTWSGVLFAATGLVLLVRPSNTAGAVIVLGGVGLATVLVLVGCVQGQRAARG